MHEMEGPRRVLLPCGPRLLGFRRLCRTCSTCSDRRLLASRARGTGCSLRSAGSDRSGPGSYAELAPRGPPVPIARVQLLRRAVAPPTRPRSLGTRQRGTASPRPASIAQDSSSRDQLRRPTGRLLACPHLGTHHLCRKPAANCGLPLLAAPRESPPGPVPVPGDKEISSGRTPGPTRAFRQHFPRVSASTGQSTGGGRLSPGNLPLSTASSTGASTAGPRTVQHLDAIRPPRERTGGPPKIHWTLRHQTRRLPGVSASTFRARAGLGSWWSGGEVGAVAAAAVAAGAAVGQEARGQHEQSGRRVEVAGLAASSAAACAASAAARPGASGGSRDGCGSVRARGASGSATGSA
jgi:hypothetical protein